MMQVPVAAPPIVDALRLANTMLVALVAYLLREIWKAVNKKLDGHETRLSGIEQRQAGGLTRLERVEIDVHEVRERLDHHLEEGR